MHLKVHLLEIFILPAAGFEKLLSGRTVKMDSPETFPVEVKKTFLGQNG